MKKQSLLLILSIALILVSCGKDEMTVGNAGDCDYFPMSVGSKFKYEFRQFNGNGQSTTSTDVSEISGTENYLGHTWFNGVSVGDDNNTSLLRCDEDELVLLAKELMVNNTLVKDYQYSLLKYPATKGRTWRTGELTQVNQGITANTYYDIEIMDTGLSMNLPSGSFSDVLLTKEISTTDYDIPGFPSTSIQIFTYRWYAKEVGHIKSTILAKDGFGDLDTVYVQTLLEYELK